MNILSTKIIEFIGLPRTGKTTTATRLCSYLKSQGYSCYLAQNHKNNPIKDKLHPEYNFWAANQFMHDYLVANKQGYDFVIADRGLLDSSIWTKLFSDKLGKPAFFDLYLTKFAEGMDHKNYVKTFYFKAKIPVILERDRQTKSEKGLNRIMNAQILTEYKAIYKDLKKQSVFPNNLIEIDTSKISLNDTFKIITTHLDVRSRKALLPMSRKMLLPIQKKRSIISNNRYKNIKRTIRPQRKINSTANRTSILK